MELPFVYATKIALILKPTLPRNTQGWKHLKFKLPLLFCVCILLQKVATQTRPQTPKSIIIQDPQKFQVFAI